jgi:signal transduction histidine kinase
MREIGITASLVIALQRGEDVFGALLVSYRRRQKFSEQQKRLARGLAQLASLALANARLQSEVERANRLKEDFVGTMSHELRTPLNIILGYSQLLCEHTFGDLNAEQVKVLDRVQTSALELLRLIDTTLDFSRLQSQRVPLEICDVHVPTLLQETADGPHQVPPKPEIQVQWRVAPDVPLLQTDAGKLKIILKNLVTNALKFTEQGSVSINAAPYDQGVIFTVTDTGPGIAQEEMALIFEPFRQGGAFATRRQGGVGLGLHIAQELVHLLGGTISVQSELGRGSTVAAWLPGKKP